MGICRIYATKIIVFCAKPRDIRSHVEMLDCLGKFHNVSKVLFFYVIEWDYQFITNEMKRFFFEINEITKIPVARGFDGEFF